MATYSYFSSTRGWIYQHQFCLSQKYNFLSSWCNVIWHTYKVDITVMFWIFFHICRISDAMAHISRAIHALISCSQIKLSYKFFYSSKHLSDLSVSNIIDNKLLICYCLLQVWIQLYYNTAHSKFYSWKIAILIESSSSNRTFKKTLTFYPLGCIAVTKTLLIRCNT